MNVRHKNRVVINWLLCHPKASSFKSREKFRNTESGIVLVKTYSYISSSSSI